MASPLFRDLQKLVSAQQQENARNRLYDRLIKKPFCIWDKEQHKQDVLTVRYTGRSCICSFIYMIEVRHCYMNSSVDIRRNSLVISDESDTIQLEEGQEEETEEVAITTNQVF